MDSGKLRETPESRLCHGPARCGDRAAPLHWLGTLADGAERAITERGRPATASWAEPRPEASRLGECNVGYTHVV